MARRALKAVRLVLPLWLCTFAGAAGCNGQVLEFQRADGSTGPGTGPGAGAGVSLAPPSGAVLNTRVVDKVDLLFDIDNSASMGDKQNYLKLAIPDLVNRLINPNCVDPTTKASSGPSNDGVCANVAEKPEFAPIHDLHLGIVSSSLGPRGGDACLATTMAPAPYMNVSAHDDDQAHLLNRSLTFSGASVTEGTVADAPSPTDQYLYWFPSGGPNMGKTPGPGTQVANANTLIQDFTDIVGGAGVFGCGLESQLESWYRFLIQPDPYQSIAVSGGHGSWVGVDTQLLAQRRDFLRPDSAVVVIVLSDENDSEIDVRSVGGQGYNWMSTGFTPPKGTSGCGTGLPGSNVATSCQSCAQGSNATSDPACKSTKGAAFATYSAVNDWGYDLNLRHVHMMAKYGIDPQFPIQRYVNGLTSTSVPDRDGEYPAGNAGSYVGTNDCQNPLFAAQLPDGSKTDKNSLCHAPPGLRTRDLVFYAHIGGVPSQLLHYTPGDAAASTLTSADWTKILGKDPVALDYTGIDPHMTESYQPRPGLAPPGSPSSADPIHGHEWITDTGVGHTLQVDRQYACTFPLVDSAGTPTPRDCTLPQNENFCDCPHVAGTVSLAQLPPICDPATQTQQTGAKAYPTIRELLLAKELGTHGIVSSICPIHVAEQTPGDPLYGYRPAVGAIVDGLKGALNNQCLAQTLPAGQAGGANCVVLLQLPNGAGGASGTCLNPTCQAPMNFVPGLPEGLPSFCGGLESEYMAQVNANGGSTTGLMDPANIPVCALRQLTPVVSPQDFQGGNCAAAPEQGWCYVSGTAAGKCSQALVFTSNALPTGATAHLVCPP